MKRQLHGAVRHIVTAERSLTAASELGDTLSADLELYAIDCWPTMRVSLRTH